MTRTRQDTTLHCERLEDRCLLSAAGYDAWLAPFGRLSHVARLAETAPGKARSPIHYLQLPPPTASSANRQPDPLGANVFLPNVQAYGVTTDAIGDVFVQATDPFAGALVAKFDPSANLLASTLVDPYATGAGFLVTYPSGGQVLTPGQIVYISSDGLGLALNPDLSGGSHLGSLQFTPTDVSDVYDVTNQQFLNLTGYLSTNTASFGDLAIVVGPQYEDWLISGQSEFPLDVPFVERLRWQGSQLTSAQVLVTSLANVPGAHDVPRGVAVNSQETVLTTLPYVTDQKGDTLDFLTAFNVGFPEGQGPIPYRPYGSNVLMSTLSSGMTTDNSNNFVVATNQVGSVVCSAGQGIVTVPGDFSMTPGCIPVTQDPVLDSWDVALSPDDSAAYLTVANLVYVGPNEVLRVPYGHGEPFVEDGRLADSFPALSDGLAPTMTIALTSAGPSRPLPILSPMHIASLGPRVPLNRQDPEAAQDGAAEYQDLAPVSSQQEVHDQVLQQFPSDEEGDHFETAYEAPGLSEVGN